MTDTCNTSENMQALMQKLQFPEAAQEELLQALQQILDHPEASALFASLLRSYDGTEDCDYVQILTDMTLLCWKLSLHTYTGNMLLCLCMSRRLRQRYLERGIDEAIFYASMMDLRYKLEECRLVYRVTGTFVPKWYLGFFKLTRFALGRLQFEIVQTTAPYTVDGVSLPEGSKAINIHIPRTGGKLNRQEVLVAYRLAAEFFRSEFPDGKVVFTCHSWMLYPWLRSVLAPGANLAAFYDDFTIVEWGEYEDLSQIWRLFDCHYTGDPEALPQDTSLRRSFVRRFKEGKPFGWGRGFFLYPKI